MNDARIEMLIARLDCYARAHLSDFRYAHSCRVASYAEMLAQRYGCTVRQQRLCFLAGIAHDLCKEKPVNMLVSLVQMDGQPIADEEKQNAGLLHGRAAAVFLREYYGIKKKSFLRAVRCHTSGSTKFNAVGKILYIADRIEPGRKNCDYLREKVGILSLDALFFEVLKESIHFLEQQGTSVRAYTYKVFRYMQAHQSC